MTIATETITGLATITAYAVCDDGLLVEQPSRGELIGFDGKEFQIRLDVSHRNRGASMLIGIALTDGMMRYAGIKVQREAVDGTGRILAGGRGGMAERILAEESRFPLFSHRQYRFELPFPQEIYSSWVQARVLRRRSLDRVLVCPHCQALPTFRFACRRCGSGRLHRDMLVHHFACAYVAPLGDFQGEKSLCCPKCRTRHLAAGTDFEYSPGQFHCQDCGWRDYELEQTGHCLHCESRFPFHQAVEIELVGYDADRLDALAHLPLLG